MTRWLLRILTNAGALAVAAWLFAGITITEASTSARVLTLVTVALLFGVVNTFIRPVVAFLSLPLYLLTFGLMFFVVNALMLGLTSWLCGALGIGFHVNGFWTLMGGSIVISVVSWLLGRAVHEGD
jgi:putative membrane protein